MSLDKSELEHFQNKGYLILDEVFEKDLSLEFCINLINIMNSFKLEKINIQNYQYLDLKQLSEITLKCLHTLELVDHKYIKIIYDTIRDTDLLYRMTNSKKILNSIYQLMGHNNKIPLYVKQVACRIDMPNDNTFSLDWHQEAHYSIKGSQFIQLWAPIINNVVKENGSIKILESSNLEGVTETIDYVPKVGHAQYKPKQEIIDKYNEIQVELKLGQVLLFSNTLIHKSGVNSSEYPRLTLLAHYHNPLNQKFLETIGQKEIAPASKNTYK